MPHFTKADIRRLVVDQTGRSDLVVSQVGNDYSDNGCNFHIHAGLRYIADNYPSKAIQSKYLQTIYAGQRYLYVPFAHSVEGLFLDDINQQLIKRELWELDRRSYRTDSEYPTGRPMAFAVDDFNGEMEIEADIRDESQTVKKGYHWVFTDQSGNIVDLDTAPSSAELERRILTFIPDTGDTQVQGSYKFDYPDGDVDARGSFWDVTIQVYVVMTEVLNSIRLSFLGEGETIQSQTTTGAYDGFLTFSAHARARGFNRFRIDYMRPASSDPAGQAVISRIRLSAHGTERLVLSPTADDTYTCYARGRFQTELANDYDHNWWTDEYPEVVVTATKLSIEGHLNRNESGENQYTASLDRRLRKIHEAREVRSKYGQRPLVRRG